jgi:hypothetical protein
MRQVENWVDVESTSGQEWVEMGSCGGIWQTWGDVDITLGVACTHALNARPSHSGSRLSGFLRASFRSRAGNAKT